MLWVLRRPGFPVISRAPRSKVRYRNPQCTKTSSRFENWTRYIRWINSQISQAKSSQQGQGEYRAAAVTIPVPRHHEVVLLQKIEDWPKFAELLSRGEQGAQRAGWMVEGLRYRDRWESKLVRCTRWSPRQ